MNGRPTPAQAEVVATPPSAPTYQKLIKQYFPADQVANATAVMKWESKENATAIGDRHLTYQQNGTTYGYSVGLFQIRYLPGRPDPAWLLDPTNNIKYAAEMYRHQGFCPWTAARRLNICTH